MLNTRNPIRPLARATGLAASIVAILAPLSACSSSPPSDRAAADPGAPGTDTNALVDSLASTYVENMNDLATLRPPDSRSGTPVSSSTGIFIEPNTDPAAAGVAAGTPPNPESAAAPVESAVASQPPPSSADPDVTALARELAAALRRRAIDGVSPYEDLSRVAMLEGIAPGVLEGLGDDAASDSAELIAVLAPSEREALRAARRTARALAESEAADPAMAADALRAAAESLDESQVIRIRTTALCTRVDGFARYVSFDSNTFLAGRSTPMIVYAEVDRFRQKPVAGPLDAPAATTANPTASTPARATSSAAPAGSQSRFVVSLTQSLNLYFAEGGLLVWRRPPQTVTDYSTGRFRDFYLIDQIELPPTLAAGSYSLKVIVRDEATGQQTESIIPITLVADPTLARGG